MQRLDIFQKEINRLRTLSKQQEKQKKMDDKRLESNKEALDAANARIDELNKFIEQVDVRVERSRALRQKEQEQSKKFGAASALEKLIPCIDSLELAIKHAETDPKSLQEGIRVIYNQFQSTFEMIGVKKIESSKGTLFDPN